MTYEQAFHDGEVTGGANERRDVVAFLRRQARRAREQHTIAGSTHVAIAIELMASCIESRDHLPPSRTSCEESKP